MIGFGSQSKAQASTIGKVFDTSEWQGSWTDAQVKSLSKEVSFLIMRVQYGSAYKDKTFNHNLQLVNKYHIPYGVYSFSMYTSASDARSEARYLHARAPKALFYANDAEQHTTSSYSTATTAWGSEMQSLTSRPVILYSYRYFYNQYIGTRKNYDAFWLASYQTYLPTPQNYALWQFSDKDYSHSLGLSLDSNKVITSQHPLSFWIGKTRANKDKTTYIAGGYKKGETVVLNKNAYKFFNPSVKIASSAKGHKYTISNTQSVKSSGSKQAVLLKKDGKIIGWALAQDVHYPNKYIKSMPKGNTIQAITKINQYKDIEFNKKAGKSYAKNKILHVKGIATSKGGATRFLLDNGNYVTGNQANVRQTSPYIIHLSSSSRMVALTGIKGYKDKNLTKPVKGKGHHKGTVFSAKGIVTRDSSHYSVLMSNGYYATAYRANVATTNKAVKSSHKTYTVKYGDSLWGIANSHSTTISKLTSLNGISASSYIYPGQKLIIK